LENLPDLGYDSIGLGDTIGKIAKALKIDGMAKAYTKVTGKDCGCNKRKDKLNKKFPYKGKK
jgi:hypothetical protein